MAERYFDEGGEGEPQGLRGYERAVAADDSGFLQLANPFGDAGGREPQRAREVSPFLPSVLQEGGDDFEIRSVQGDRLLY